MGRKKKGVKKNVDSREAVAPRDDDAGNFIGEDGIYGDDDMWEREQDEAVLDLVKRRRNKADKDDKNEVFALSGTDSDSDLELPKIKSKKKVETGAGAGTDDSEESDFNSGEETEDIRKWGKKKKYYYGGNTGEEQQGELDDSDLEEDEIEEQEAAQLQSRQLELMDEEDFIDAYALPRKESVQESSPSLKSSHDFDPSKLSKKEQIKLFKQQSPEFDGVIADFQMRMAEGIKLSKVVTLAEKENVLIGPVMEYIKNKLELTLNYCTNILAYLMFKSRGVNLTLHPVTGTLVQYRQLLDRLHDMDNIVMPKVDEFLKNIENGQTIKQMIKQEQKKKNKKVINSKQKSPPGHKERTNTKKKRKAPVELASELENLTVDERIAVEMYKAIKRKKPDVASESEEELEEDVIRRESEEEVEENVTPEGGNSYDLDDESEEKRAITYTIAKNKGLMPKRSKLQRNPRVKNRMKYEKAKKRRKGAVREIRDQTQKYSGEASGMNIRVKKGVKFQ